MYLALLHGPTSTFQNPLQAGTAWPWFVCVMLLFVFPLAIYLLKLLHTRSDVETSYTRLLLTGSGVCVAFAGTLAFNLAQYSQKVGLLAFLPNPIARGFASGMLMANSCPLAPPPGMASENEAGNGLGQACGARQETPAAASAKGDP